MTTRNRWLFVAAALWAGIGLGVSAPMAASPRSPQAAPPPRGAQSEFGRLTGVDWRLVRLGAQAVGPGASRRHPYLRFEGNGVHGSAGCNTFRGTYVVSGSELTFPGLAATQMACPDMDIERAFLKALGATTAWRMAAARLELLDKAGEVLAVFEANREAPGFYRPSEPTEPGT